MKKMRLQHCQPPTPKQNRLLGALPPTDFERLLPHLERVRLPLGWALYDAGSEQGHVYFPADCIMSLLHDVRDGPPAEMAVVGYEGVVGITLLMGGETTPGRAVVQSAGYSFRLNAALLKKDFDRASPLHQLLLRYAQALISQMAQTAMCNLRHATKQQLCRSLLLSLDRLPPDELAAQELTATMLDVGPEEMTKAAAEMQAQGMIRCSHGMVTVLDRRRLETQVCECYAAVRHEYERLLSPGAILSSVAV